MRSVRWWRWHSDEVFVRVDGVQQALWRAVDHEGEVLGAYVTKKRAMAALTFPEKPMKRHGRADKPVTDKLRTCGFGRRDRAMPRLGQMHGMQKLTAVHSSVQNRFDPERSLPSRVRCEQARTAAPTERRALYSG